MNTTVKYILIAIVALTIIGLVYKAGKQTGCYVLPNNVDPNVFGPHYWKAFHNIADRIPCNLCKPFTQKFMIFFHDTVNKKLGKPLYDENNYNEMIKEINLIASDNG